MIHLLQNTNGEYYWLGVSKKANTFEEICRDTEFHPNKEDAVNNALVAAKIFASGKYWWLADHTTGKLFRYFKTNKKPEEKKMPGAQFEIDFVKEKHKDDHVAN